MVCLLVNPPLTLFCPHPYRTPASPWWLLLVLVHSGPRYSSPSSPFSPILDLKEKLHLPRHRWYCQPQWLLPSIGPVLPEGSLPLVSPKGYPRGCPILAYSLLCAWQGCILPTVDSPDASSLWAGWHKLKLLLKPPFILCQLQFAASLASSNRLDTTFVVCWKSTVHWNVDQGQHLFSF